MSCRLSARSLERALQGALSTATISKFLGYTTGAYLTFLLENFSFSARQRVNTEKKAYLVDNGFFSATHIGPLNDHSRLLENYVFIELLRRGKKPNLELFYYRTKGGLEVDFLVLEQGKPESLIQSCFTIAPFQGETWQRETRALIAAAKETGVQNLKIVTLEESARFTIDGYTIEACSVLDSW
jgi:predicted AAA+ superfamily ATPase